MNSKSSLDRLRLVCLPVLMSVAVFCLLLASSATAQVLVYRIEFSKNQGINYSPFNGGYFAAPVLGGTGSFLLTSTDGERTFTASSTSGTLFTATNHGEKKAVISATTGSGTAAGAFVALGDISHTLSVNSPTVTLSVKVAESLIGMAVSADTESTATAPAADGSIGSAGYSTVQFVLDTSQTDIANKQGLSLSQTMDQLTLVLEREGFTQDTTTTGTGTGTTGTGTTGTGTTTGTTGTTGTTTTSGTVTGSTTGN